MAQAKTMTPKELATELKVDPKRLRAYLRKEHGRSPEAKNTSWAISAAAVKAARAHFSKKAK